MIEDMIYTFDDMTCPEVSITKHTHKNETTLSSDRLNNNWHTVRSHVDRYNKNMKTKCKLFFFFCKKCIC